MAAGGASWFRGRAYLVTGAARGIGRAIAAELIEHGARVALIDSDAKAGEAAAAELGEAARFHAADVAIEAEVQAAVAAVTARFGRLDGLVNNAGISRNRPLAELTLDDWNRVLAVNLTSVFLFARAAAPHLALAPDGGAIVNLASTRALMSEADTEAYSASKGGIVALTHALAVSLGPQVRVNCISPGWIHTKGPEPGAEDRAWHPAGRVGRVQDVAALARFLLSGEAGFVTGANFTADGGVTRKMVYPD
ncbi:MAG TPA: glucose 1-dehydrogenase [Alphaproteobacteria bacterium]|nr:glucose 1-dehydrogenase [Alphaproteobacteria bacterium]